VEQKATKSLNNPMAHSGDAELFEAEQDVVNNRFYASSSYAALLWSAGIINNLIKQ
jgi:hypothetical protein